jgi:hypothetical protein
MYFVQGTLGVNRLKKRVVVVEVGEGIRTEPFRTQWVIRSFYCTSSDSKHTFYDVYHYGSPARHFKLPLRFI